DRHYHRLVLGSNTDHRPRQFLVNWYEMKPGLAALLSIGNPEEIASNEKAPSIANLAAHFGVKRRSIKDDRGPVVDPDYFEYSGWHLQFVVANELRRD